MPEPHVTGCVLAGGRSSRMGQDKALLSLAGSPLIERAVRRLSRVAQQVVIVGSRPDLAIYAPIVPDLREGQGPLAGVATAFSATESEWLLFIAVDMPFVPVELLSWWMRHASRRPGTRASVFVDAGEPQPALCLLHRELGPLLERRLQDGQLRLMPALREASRAIADSHGLPLEEVLWELDTATPELQTCVSAEQWEGRSLWFANLNTPEEFQIAVQQWQRIVD